MKANVSIALVLLLAVTACKPQKAIDFEQNITKYERRVLDMMVGKGGIDEEKLKCLINHDFKGAALAVDKEEQVFNKILDTISSLPADGIKQGDALKKVTVDYYVALKELYIFDRQEIEQRAASFDPDKEKAERAMDKYIQLSRDKQKMYDSMFKKDAVYRKALEEFEKANGI